MNAWRTDDTVPQAATAKGDGVYHHDAISHPVSAAGQLKQKQTPADGGPRSFAGSIKQLFREVKRALTGKESAAPEPKKRVRRRTEETRGAFRLARNIMLRVIRSIFHPSNYPWESPCELDDAHRQQLHWNSQSGFHETGGFDSPTSPSSNHLSPDL
jgi:hypothetical protein